ncbi:MAG: nuclear transport factor 2 family protein [Bacteroidia bacterium]
MKYIVCLSVFFCYCSSPTPANRAELSEEVATLIEQWHRDAANANLEGYIGLMDSTCNYIGTDATENWKRYEFASFCKPYFDKKKTWNFTTAQRDVRVNATGNTAWFDEILDTHMGTCRGSGALELKNGEWKLMKYVLSVAIPNESMEAVK